MNTNFQNVSDNELMSIIDSLKEVYDYLTRPDASYEERCFSEQVKSLAEMHSQELSSRNS